MTNGSIYGSFQSRVINNSTYTVISEDAYNQNVASSGNTNKTMLGKIGMTTDSSASGVVAKSDDILFWRLNTNIKFAIKY